MTELYTISENEGLIARFKFLTKMPGYYGVTDSNLIYKSTSPCAAKLFGWNKPENAVNQSVYNIRSRAVEAANLYDKSSNISMQLQKPIVAVQIVNRGTAPQIFMTQKIPIITNKNAIKGVFISCMELSNVTRESCQWIQGGDKHFTDTTHAPKQYILTPEASPLPLSNRQQECLALLIRGKTYKEISHALNVSDRTIEDHIHAIKYKLGCYNKSQLIEKAIDSGFLFHVPETLFGLLR